MNAFNDDQDDELSALLVNLRRVDPPPALLGSVMSTIDSANPQQTPHTVTFTTKGRTMAKRVLWIVAAAAAVALVIMGVTGYPPVEKGAEATIGAAQRYQAQQISNADVKTDDPQMQAFLQSELFHKLSTDKAAREALKNKDFQRALADADVRAALAMPQIRMAIADSAANVLASARLDAAAKATLEAALQASPALAQALAQPQVAAAIANSALALALSQADAAFALSRDYALNAIRAADVAGSAAPNAIGGAVGQ